MTNGDMSRARAIFLRGTFHQTTRAWQNCGGAVKENDTMTRLGMTRTSGRLWVHEKQFDYLVAQQRPTSISAAD